MIPDEKYKFMVFLRDENNEMSFKLTVKQRNSSKKKKFPSLSKVTGYFRYPVGG